jgi:hypothetical protein
MKYGYGRLNFSQYYSDHPFSLLISVTALSFGGRRDDLARKQNILTHRYLLVSII